jgi:hypothetical protein
VAAAIVGAIDQQTANTTGAHLSECDLSAGRAVRGFGLSCGRASSPVP